MGALLELVLLVLVLVLLLVVMVVKLLEVAGISGAGGVQDAHARKEEGGDLGRQEEEEGECATHCCERGVMRKSKDVSNPPVTTCSSSS
jgi:hypothetical protein